MLTVDCLIRSRLLRIIKDRRHEIVVSRTLSGLRQRLTRITNSSKAARPQSIGTPTDRCSPSIDSRRLPRVLPALISRTSTSLRVRHSLNTYPWTMRSSLEVTFSRWSSLPYAPWTTTDHHRSPAYTFEASRPLQRLHRRPHRRRLPRRARRQGGESQPTTPLSLGLAPHLHHFPLLRQP